MIENCDYDSDLVFLCDQDDIWLEVKVSTFLQKLPLSAGSKGLYISNSRLWPSFDGVVNTVADSYFENFEGDEEEKINACLGPGQFFYGHNMAITGSLAKQVSLVMRGNERHVFSHDRFLFYWVNLMDLPVTVDSTPLVLYRQHSAQVIGGVVDLGLPSLLSKRFIILKESTSDLVEALRLTKVPLRRKLYYVFIHITLFFRRRK
jgi:hypothetical protein